ncbi:leucine-rich repeat domain-containing protein [Pseudoteredinibacter isoporae]|uniref:Leucine-rich repeat (LRR) protein n=1 Tax=Pseudoteredinibacter isoporae TaxID=570281 RepID=A0A7X0JUS6_9GAMM|nr:leucine-rich repeat domain-containing protein [Pseudoteredinibacter isoporae]MBB6521771.1 Leucine-rich repeat (LRR) protein [Pseudoteredinibacter isoporae]NHO87318.1 leucine-rich repeat domain-containing protein [Pseudoteredinibacter isoporae]NIB23050.1 leucine-rich repeat domain-containing protein [Pseudoteredinibacter isoporae]
MDIFSRNIDSLCDAGLGASHDEWCDLDGRVLSVSDNLMNEELKHVKRFLLRQESAGMKQWRDKLGLFERLVYFAIEGSVNQNFFESVCQLSQLKRLSIVRSRVKSIEKIQHLSNLTHFNLMGSPGLESFGPLRNLSGLSALSLCGDFKVINSLDCLAELPFLKSLTLSGIETKAKKYQSLSPIMSMCNLKAIMLFNVHFLSQGLTPLAKLKKLEYIVIPRSCLKFWGRGDYRLLYESLPNLKTEWVELAAFNTEFQREYKIT